MGHLSIPPCPHPHELLRKWALLHVLMGMLLMLAGLLMAFASAQAQSSPRPYGIPSAAYELEKLKRTQDAKDLVATASGRGAELYKALHSEALAGIAEGAQSEKTLVVFIDPSTDFGIDALVNSRELVKAGWTFHWVPFSLDGRQQNTDHLAQLVGSGVNGLLANQGVSSPQSEALAAKIEFNRAVLIAVLESMASGTARLTSPTSFGLSAEGQLVIDRDSRFRGHTVERQRKH